MEEQEKMGLSRYRMSRAERLLSTARRVQQFGDFNSVIDRVYFCVFHSMGAVFALDTDYKRRAAVFGRFKQEYINTGVFDSDFGEIFRKVARMRKRSEVEDFYICTQAETEELIRDAARFLEAVRAYLETQRGVSFPN